MFPHGVKNNKRSLFGACMLQKPNTLWSIEAKPISLNNLTWEKTNYSCSDRKKLINPPLLAGLMNDLQIADNLRESENRSIQPQLRLLRHKQVKGQMRELDGLLKRELFNLRNKEVQTSEELTKRKHVKQEAKNITHWHKVRRIKNIRTNNT